MENYKDIISALRNGTVPAEGTENIAVGIDREIEQIEQQLDDVAQNKTDFKFIIGDYGSGKTFFSTAVREKSFDKGFAVSSVVVSQEAPLNKFEELYKKIIEGIRTKENKKLPALSSLLEEWLLGIEDKVIELEGITPEEDEEKFKKRVLKKIEEDLKIIGEISSEFANALRSYYEAKYTGDNVIIQAILGWMKGDSIPNEYKKIIGIRGRLSRENSFNFFRVILHIIKNVDYKGLLIIIDEIETVQKYTKKTSRDAAYENLRFFIDESDRNGFPNCFFLYSGTTELMETERGFKSLEPFYQRIKTEKDDKFRNLRQPIIYLQEFNNEKLKQVSEKVKLIHGKVFNWDPSEKVTDRFINTLIEDKTKAFGGEIKINPRGFLRMFIDILDKSETHNDYFPEKEFKFDENTKKQIQEIEREEAHIINF